MKKAKTFTVIISSLLLFVLCISTAFAEAVLPEGAVKGLPEKLTAMDSNGNTVNTSTGEYYFYVNNMSFCEVYTKDIQLMNLRDDKAYHIYFYIEPKPESKKGNIDLEKDCICSFYLDDVNFYQGSVAGVGNIDLTEKAKDLGYYKPGESHKLTCSIAWVGDPGDYYIDEGHRIVSHEGVQIVRGRSGQDTIRGEFEFKWIFAAEVDESFDPPNTGFFAADGTFLLVLIVILSMLIITVSILIVKRKKV